MLLADYQRLETERPLSGMGGVGAIPIVRMYEYLAATRTPREEWELFVSLFREMDAVTLQHYAQRMKADRGKLRDGAKGKKPLGGKQIVDPADYPE